MKNEYLNLNEEKSKEIELPRLKITDINFDDLSKMNEKITDVDLLEKSSGKGFLSMISQYMKMTNPKDWLFIIFFSSIATIILFMLDKIIAFGINLRLTICSTSFPFLNLIIWMTTAVIFLLIATSVGKYIAAEADGSGIPEVKTVLSGMNIHRCFSVETFVAKSIGLLAALIGGASTGKVGPYVHLSSIICSRLMKIKYFSSINNSSTRNAMITAASAAGITLALGTPLGGVIFSMEVTSSIYSVNNLTKAFGSVTICILITKILNSSSTMNLFNANEMVINFEYIDLFFFIILGLICGIIGAMLSTFVAKLVYIRRKSSLSFLNNRFYYAIVSAIIISLITFSVKPLMIFDRYMLSNIFKSKLPKELNDLNHPNEAIILLTLFSLKFLITVISLAINMPAGIFAPFFVIGAYFGRFYGHIISMIFSTSEEAVYAMVGAACVMSGATHSISSAIIIFELTGHSSYLLPMLAACLISNLVAQAMAMSFFDVFLLMKNLPHLPSIKSSAIYNLTAESIMSKEVYCINSSDFNYINAMELLFKIPHLYNSIPVIDNNGIIKYTVIPKKIAKYIYYTYDNYKLNYEADIQHKLNNVVMFLRYKFGKKYPNFFTYLKYKFKKIIMTKKEKEIKIRQKQLKLDEVKLDLTFLKNYSYEDNLILKSFIEDDQILKIDKGALTVDKSYSLLKLQFLFTFLNISQIYVYDNNILSGVINKEDFVRKTMVMK